MKQFIVTMFFIPLVTGCLPWFAVIYPFPGSFGTTSVGLLSDGQTLSKVGNTYRLYKHESKAFALPVFTSALVRTAERLAERYPGSILMIGDMSTSTGGFVSGHRSHRSGRDADLAFFTTDIYGNPSEVTSNFRFDRFGIGCKKDLIRLFDVARNWSLVEILLNDEQIEIQWIFVSNGLKALLLEWAIKNDQDLNTIARASKILREPGDSAPHDDHFHVRIYCPQDNSSRLCTNVKPYWPWLRTENKKIYPTDEMLFKAATEGLN